MMGRSPTSKNRPKNHYQKRHVLATRTRSSSCLDRNHRERVQKLRCLDKKTNQTQKKTPYTSKNPLSFPCLLNMGADASPMGQNAIKIDNRQKKALEKHRLDNPSPPSFLSFPSFGLDPKGKSGATSNLHLTLPATGKTPTPSQRVKTS